MDVRLEPSDRITDVPCCRFQHPWGVDHSSDKLAFQQLRDWTLAQVQPCRNNLILKASRLPLERAIQQLRDWTLAQVLNVLEKLYHKHVSSPLSSCATGCWRRCVLRTCLEIQMCCRNVLVCTPPSLGASAGLLHDRLWHDNQSVPPKQLFVRGLEPLFALFAAWHCRRKCRRRQWLVGRRRSTQIERFSCMFLSFAMMYVDEKLFMLAARHRSGGHEPVQGQRLVCGAARCFSLKCLRFMIINGPPNVLT